MLVIDDRIINNILFKDAPGSKFQEVIARRTEMDMNTKMREDPLFAIRYKKFTK